MPTLRSGVRGERPALPPERPSGAGQRARGESPVLGGGAEGTNRSVLEYHRDRTGAFVQRCRRKSEGGGGVGVEERAVVRVLARGLLGGTNHLESPGPLGPS